MSVPKAAIGGGIDNDPLDQHAKSLFDMELKSMDSSGEPVKENPSGLPKQLPKTVDPMHSNLMTVTQMLEAMDDVETSMKAEPESDIMNTPVGDSSTACSDLDEKELMNKLNQLFTPVLVAQQMEQDISADQTNAELSEAGVLNERTTINFDPTDRMAQLIAVCARLINQCRNSENWQLFKKADALKKQADLNMQKDSHDEAKELAQKYLVMVSTTSNSSVARSAANALLPETQH